MDNQQNPDIFFMRSALDQARLAAEAGEVPIGAVVVCGGRIVARGHNLVESLHDPTAHAEMQAITSATGAIEGKYLEDCTLYVTLEPCPMCAGALYLARMGRIVYGASDPKRGYTTVQGRLLHPKTSVTKGVLGEECEEIINNFFTLLRK